MSGKNVFNSVHVPKVGTSRFDLSHDVKLSLSMGNLVPINCMEVIPGDKFNIRSEVMLRFAPMVAPVMHRINVFIHYFFVPNRLVWSNWQKFITDNEGKGNVPAPPMQRLETPIAVGSLGDYMGLPTGVSNLRFSLIPFSAYQLIFNEYYRDQNLQSEVLYQLSDGQTTSGDNAILHMRRRAWMHDYFTASLPFAQKGGAVSIPLGNFEDVPLQSVWNGSQSVIRNSASGTPISGGASSVLRFDTPGGMTANPGTGGSLNAYLDNSQQLIAKTSQLSEATAATINDLRRAFRLQEWLEKMARGGSRYIEQNLVHFGVRSSDARLQRPEFIGGSKQPVIISEVLQTSESQETPQGSMAGHGISASSGKTISYYAEEHGYLIGIMSVMPVTAYQQGIPRHFSRMSHLDYAWPTFAHIGEQAVLNKEIYADGTVDDEGTWGYVPRYSEYRYLDSRVAGAFRDTLSFWHLGRIFGSRPALNASFIECNPRNDIFAVPSETQNLWSQVYNSVSVKRKLPKYGTPMM